MSTNMKGFMGDQIGKLGPAVGRRWKGLMVYSAYQKFVHNPKSARQLANRAKFGTLGKMGGGLLKALRYGYHKDAQKFSSTEVAVFLDTNWRRVSVNPTTLAVTVNYDEISLSNGVKNVPIFGQPDFSTSGKVVVPVTDGRIDEDNPATDRLMVAVYNPAFEKALYNDLTAMRDASEVQVEVPSAWQGCEVHVYGFAVASATARDVFTVSDTAYIGSGTLS